MFQCNVCHKIFSYRNSMYRHRKCHEEYKSKSSPVYICDHCGVIEQVKKNLIKHIKLHHRIQNSKQQCKTSCPGIRLKCPAANCNDHLKTFRKLDEHLSFLHEIDVQEEYLEFNNEGEFRTWKLNTEKRTQTQYAAERGIRKLKDGKQREYICHRSYDPKKRSTERERASKSIGTNKIGAACPSRMIVKMFTEKVEVNFISTHVGHLNEAIRMRLPSHQRAEITGNLKNGVPIQRVLADVRNSANPENFERLHYIQRNDISNIIRGNNIGYLTCLHSDEIVSVELLVDTLRKQDDSPILHYKNDDENFILIIMTAYQKYMLLEHQSKICIGRTHGLNAYGYQLVSILVIDEHNNGIPVAFCFTKKTDLSAITLFYTKVKEKIGSDVNIQCYVFMSDDAPQFYEAWINVMGQADHKLLCWWHVNKTWVKNLNIKIQDKVKRKFVLQTLRTLATLTSDEEDFETKLTKFLEDLCADPDTLPFHDYLQSHYISKKMSWAFCYRRHLGLNTNMHIKAFHKQIKYTYLEGKQCPRLDKAINALFSYLRDSMFERIIKLEKNCPTEKIVKIGNAHSKRVTITDNEVKSVDEFKWHVKSQSDKDLIYVVVRKDTKCNSCVLTCPECRICIHTFECSCADNTIYLNICKHIHKVADKNKGNHLEKPDCALLVQKTDLLKINPQITHSLNDDKENQNHSTKIDKEQIRTKTQLILQSVDTLSDDDVEQVAKQLDNVLRTIIAKKRKV